MCFGPDYLKKQSETECQADLSSKLTAPDELSCGI